MERTVVDLFCGAGGLSAGFQRAGFVVSRAVDHAPAAIETYRRNLGPHATCQEITEGIDLPRAAVIAGGPPCQGFSSAGQRRSGDRRNTLVALFARIVAASRPRAFLFENVEGFLTAEEGERVLDLLVPLISAGYRIHLRKVSSANFGVPQHRKRVVAIGGLGWDPTFPAPTHSARGAPGAHLAAQGLPPTPSLGDAILGLPAASDRPPGVPGGHFCAELDAEELARIRALGPGQTMRDLPQELWHPSYRRRAYRRVMDGTPTERRGGAPAGIRRLRPDEPSKAITGGARSELIHPFEDRYLTPRECARVQTFPDDFDFLGNAAEQSRMIGNAVPPRLASVLAVQLARDLDTSPARAGSGGALLSFVPTLSAGMSPALERITGRVRSLFHGGSAAEKQPHPGG